jgi:hypothetical protein
LDIDDGSYTERVAGERIDRVVDGGVAVDRGVGWARSGARAARRITPGDAKRESCEQRKPE